jgi:hypothetical protein
MRSDSLSARGLVADDDLRTRLAVFDEEGLGDGGRGEKKAEREAGHGDLKRTPGVFHASRSTHHDAPPKSGAIEASWRA